MIDAYGIAHDRSGFLDVEGMSAPGVTLRC